MQRYIDVEKAVEEARLAYCKKCDSINGLMCIRCPFDDAMDLIEEAPTADVVPKSEVDELMAIIADHKANEGLLEELYANAKTEVVREIFEAIDQIFRRQYELCSQTDFKLLEPILQGERFTINEMWHKVAELKKKYTGGRLICTNHLLRLFLDKCEQSSKMIFVRLFKITE